MKCIGWTARAAASLGVGVVCAGLAVACGSDKPGSSPLVDADSGAGGVAGGRGSGGAGTGGDKNSSGGTPGSGGTHEGTGGERADAGRNADASSDLDGGADGAGLETHADASDGAPRASEDGGSDSSAPFDQGSGRLLVTGTDHTGSEVAIVSRPSGTVTVNTVMPFTSDVRAVVSDGRAFYLEQNQGADKVDPLDADGIPVAYIALNADLPDGGVSPAAPWLNPRDLVVVGKKAFVSLHNTSRVAVLDLDTNTVTTTIDLSQFDASGDTDGSIDLDRGFYDATSGRVYFVASRTDFAQFEVCQSFPALLIAIDPATNQVDSSISLKLASPTAAAYDSVNRRIFVAASGCMDGSRTKSGVEAMNLASGTTSVVYDPASGANTNRFVVVNGTDALLETYDETYNPVWNRLDLSNGTFGAKVSHLPDGIVGDGPDAVVGVVFEFDGTASQWRQTLVRQRLSDGKRVVINNGQLFAVSSWSSSYGVVQW